MAEVVTTEDIKPVLQAVPPPPAPAPAPVSVPMPAPLPVQEPIDDSNVCRDYKRGVCNRGSKCKFVHPPNIKPPDVEKPPVCRDFQNGTCDRPNCKYMHITSEEERVFVRSGKLPAHARQPSLSGSGAVCKDFLNNVCNRGSRCKFRHVTEAEWEKEKHGLVIDDDLSRKRKRDSFGGGSGLDYQFLSDENDMLRRKVADLQRQVADLRAMNDTLYEQNMRYRSQLKNEMTGEARNTGAVSYPGYPRDREQAVRYPRDAYNGSNAAYQERPPTGQTAGFSTGYTKDYNPTFTSTTTSTAYEGYTKF